MFLGQDHADHAMRLLRTEVEVAPFLPFLGLCVCRHCAHLEQHGYMVPWLERDSLFFQWHTRSCVLSPLILLWQRFELWSMPHFLTIYVIADPQNWENPADGSVTQLGLGLHWGWGAGPRRQTGSSRAQWQPEAAAVGIHNERGRKRLGAQQLEAL